MAPGRLAERLRARLRGTAGARAPARPAPPPDADPGPVWRLVLRGLRELSGFDRGVLYDVPADQAPARLPGTPVYLRGSPAWQAFLRAREMMDTGELTLLLALRGLGDVERMLAVDWGTTYANAFLYVEPRDPLCDLTDPDNRVRRSLEAAARALLRHHDPDEAPHDPWTRRTPLGDLLRRAYGAWVTWREVSAGWADEERIDLVAAGPEETLAEQMLPRLRARFPQPVFDATLARLLEHEAELFAGRPVARARMPFLTRLGLPVLHDPRCADRALRRLVNEGRAWVYGQGPDAVSYHGPDRPIPAHMTDDEFERLIV
jgi:hypothetical protein